MTSAAKPEKQSAPSPRALFTLVFMAGCLLIGFVWCSLFVRVFAPERRAAAPPPAASFDAQPALAWLRPDAVAAEQQKILALGSRYLGHPGMYAAEELVRARFRELGLELFEQTAHTVVPHTARREILSEPSLEPLLDVDVYPFMPNHLQPVVTRAEGVSGELVLLDRETLANRHDFHDVIGVIDAGANVDPSYAYQWARYAGLGLKAILIAHRNGIESLDIGTITKQAREQSSGLVSSVPVNFVRLAATPEVFAHLGERVRVRVRVDFVERANRTLFGVLRAKQRADEAIVVYAPYDTPAVLPDLAPGAIPAVNLAYLLNLARALAASRDTLTRDVVFVASGSSVMGEDGLNELLRVLSFNTFASRSNRLFDAFAPFERDQSKAVQGASSVLATRLAPLERTQSENAARLESVRAVLSAFSKPEFLQQAAPTRAALAALKDEARRFFDSEFQYVLNTVVFERQEPVLQAKLELERRRDSSADSPQFRRYLALRQALDRANSAAGSPAPVLLANNLAFVRDAHIRERAKARFEELLAHHQQRAHDLAQDRSVAEYFSRYREFALLRPHFTPDVDAAAKSEVITLHAQSARETQSVDLLLQATARKLGLEGERFHVEPIAQNPGTQLKIIENNCDPAPRSYYQMLYSTGYQVYGLVNLNRQAAYQQWASPVVAPFMTQLGTLSGSFAATGQLLLELAHGSGLIGSPQGYPWQRKSFGGKVLVSNIGQSVVPSYPLAHAVLAARSVDKKEAYSQPGFWENPLYMADPYGRFEKPEQAADFGVWWRMYSDGYAYTPLAVGYDADGFIAYMKDEGEESQRLFRSMMVPLTNEQLVKNVSIVTFRAAPMTIVDLTNPQNFKDYSGVQMLTTEGLTPFAKKCEFQGLGFITTFLPPDRRADILLQSSRPDNEYVKETRAFLIGPPPQKRGAPREIEGEGYLVADHPILLDVPFEAATSMLRVNGQRLDLQNRFGMADERTNSYHERTRQLLNEAKKPELTNREAVLKARDAVSYAGLNHPVLRESVFEAVVGILWYLGLLVPFVFFAEKLIFCYADVRRQLAAELVIFLVVFGLLRLLHPAFQMVRSSLMILLGFVIVLIATGITLIFTSKARENLAELRKRQGRVEGAEVNTLGVIASSFLVGLNNMHRRRVRTGLTCATLVLLTFVMICFTSTQNDVVDETVTVGRAEYQGLLSKHENFGPLSESELFALKSKFGDRFSVNERRFLTGERDWNERKRVTPRIQVNARGNGDARSATINSIMRLSADEPLRNKLRFLTQRAWFSAEQARDESSPAPLMLPDKLAERLGIVAAAVDASEVHVDINGTRFRVWSIFEAESLDALRDLDGRDLLPYDMERVANVDESADNQFLVPDDSPRVPAERVLLAPLRDLKLGNIAFSRDVVASVAIDMSRAGFRQAKQEIEAHLEKTALPASFGLDGVAYRGLRTRKLTLAGLLDLLVPLLLAGLTVLNTMRGSVYERKGEIYVYNAVGIAPRYILAMFFAEAFVYAVVGSVLGYILSQGTGRVLTALGYTGGLNMTFTSLATIYASLAIVAAVFVSTWFPARSAMEIAAPAEDSGWSLPAPDGDVLAFDLPFNFRARDRLAVLAFFERWLKEHGEGSAGPFFASIPALAIANEPDPVNQGAVPEMQLMVWLKPLDLAVSQSLAISTPTDAETGEFKARLVLTRQSGTREAWLRLNQSFVATLRRHFLHWRAVPNADRDALFVEAKAALQARYPEWARAAEAIS
ncbi:MAG: ABC transporter permease [Myxococcota bacterium]